MSSFSALRPHRSLTLPFVLVLYPLLWFVVRDAGISAVGRPVTDVLPRAVALATGAIVASYAFAVLADATVVPAAESVPSRARPLVRPSNGTLAAFGAVSLALGAYVVASSLVAFPGWFDALASGVGVVVGWPLLLALLGTFAVGNALPALQDAFAVQVGIVAVGIALSTAWLFLLSGWVSRLVGARVGAGSGP